MAFLIRQATLDDIDYLVAADIKTDIEDTGDTSSFTEDEAKAHRMKIISFVTDDSKGAWVATNNDKLYIGMILSRDLDYDIAAKDYPVFREIGRDVFPADGRFCEVYQLWVEAKYRRRGIATQLKQQLESYAKKQSLQLIYTHTREANSHVIRMNENLDYREVRRGTMWDDVIRVSLVKDL